MFVKSLSWSLAYIKALGLKKTGKFQISLKENNIAESFMPIMMFNDREQYSKETHIVKSLR